MLAVVVALGAVLLVLIAEGLHARRVRIAALLAFGPRGRAATWVLAVPWLRSLATGALVWGLLTLMTVEPKSHSADGGELLRDDQTRHVLLVLDVSPSMRLVDAGPTAKQSRMQRAREVMDSFFRRIPLEQYRISVIATYNGAKRVVVETSDVEVVRNILGDLPMHYAFQPGKTKLLAGLEEACKLARPWNPNSTVLVLVSDGDTVPAVGMPRRPASISDVIVVGVGDPVSGRFIDGRQSRQDVATLRQIATRLGGKFHNGNTHHLATSLISDLSVGGDASPLEQLSRREYALICTGLGAALLALMPLLLSLLGTDFKPGRRPERVNSSGTTSRLAAVSVESTRIVRSG